MHAQLVKLRGADDYMGGLDTAEDRDGLFTFTWTGDVTRVRHQSEGI